MVFLLPDIKKKEDYLLQKLFIKLCKVHDKEGIRWFDLDLSKMIFKKELSKILSNYYVQKNCLLGRSSIQYNKPSVKGWHTDDPINELNNNFGEILS